VSATLFRYLSDHGDKASNGACPLYAKNGHVTSYAAKLMQGMSIQA
jgi:hypothetical protein